MVTHIPTHTHTCTHAHIYAYAHTYTRTNSHIDTGSMYIHMYYTNSDSSIYNCASSPLHT